jgi:hypothetical protein
MKIQSKLINFFLTREYDTILKRIKKAEKELNIATDVRNKVLSSMNSLVLIKKELERNIGEFVRVDAQEIPDEFWELKKDETL